MQLDFGDFSCGCLGIDVELADGFELGIEEFEAEGAWGLVGEDIDDAAADGELAAGGDGGVALVAEGDEVCREGVRVEVFAGFQVGAVVEEGLGGGGVLREGIGAAEDDEGFGSGKGFEDGEPGGGGFGVLDFVEFISGVERGVREGEGGESPDLQFVCEALALARGWVCDPMAAVAVLCGGAAGEGDEEGV